MSHIVSINTEVRDAAAVKAACTRLKLENPLCGVHQLFDGSTVKGLAVKLPGWYYPVVCTTETGKVSYDNYNGHWGKQVELDKFLQSYAVEKAKIESRKKGHSVSEQLLTDGSIKLTIQISGGAA